MQQARIRSSPKEFLLVELNADSHPGEPGFRPAASVIESANFVGAKRPRRVSGDLLQSYVLLLWATSYMLRTLLLRRSKRNS